MIQLKSAREIEVMALGGRILALTHQHLRTVVRPGISTGELDVIAEDFIRSHDGALPAFKGLYGFPGAICISVNEEIVHGIPSPKKVLRDGDIVKLDVGVQYQSLFTDAAITVPVGSIDPQTRHLIDVSERALAAGIEQAIVGNYVGDIGHAVQTVVERAGLSVVRELVGHGVGHLPHEDPQVPNHGKPRRGARLQAGLTIAIEPMVNVGGPMTRTLSDKWTVVTLDGTRSCHVEHTVAVTDAGPRVLTVL